MGCTERVGRAEGRVVPGVLGRPGWWCSETALLDIEIFWSVGLHAVRYFVPPTKEKLQTGSPEEGLQVFVTARNQETRPKGRCASNVTFKSK